MNAAEPSNKSDALITPLPWASRTSGMPYLPGGGDKQVQILKILFQAIEEADGYDKTTVDLGDGISRTLQEATKQVTPAGLVTRLNREQVAVSPESQRWLQSGKIEDLFAVFHKHVRYVGEFLRELEVSPLSTRDLNNLAAEKYDLQWNTLDQIRRRTSWLLSMGLIERRTSKLLGITEKGKACVELLGEDEIAYPAPEPTRTDESAELSEPPAPIRQLIDSLDEKKLRERKSAIGYIPRGNREFDATEALLNLVNACSPRITRIELRSHAMTTFGVSESSFAASLTTLTSAGLIEETSLNVFAPTDAGAAWLETGKAEDLVLIFHSKFLFVLEILLLLSEFDKAPGLARAAAEHFGMSRPDVGGVRLRLQLLKAAGLVYERANWRFRATALGHAFAETYPLQKITDDEDTEALARCFHGK